MIERLYITGFMTSGKSTIGPILANVIGWAFKDLDKEIEKAEGCLLSRSLVKRGRSTLGK